MRNLTLLVLSLYRYWFISLCFSLSLFSPLHPSPSFPIPSHPSRLYHIRLSKQFFSQNDCVGNELIKYMYVQWNLWRVTIKLKLWPCSYGLCLRFWYLSSLGGYFVQIAVLWGHAGCPLSRVERCPLLGGSKCTISIGRAIGDMEFMQFSLLCFVYICVAAEGAWVRNVPFLE